MTILFQLIIENKNQKSVIESEILKFTRRRRSPLWRHVSLMTPGSVLRLHYRHNGCVIFCSSIYSYIVGFFTFYGVKFNTSRYIKLYGIICRWQNILTMPHRCVIFGCSNTPGSLIALHKFPEKGARCRQWINFVQKTRKWVSTPLASRICSAHFTKDSFSNYMKVSMGITKMLLLNK